ncbi:hypothetical protein CspeluHIS016_0801890 [Cutaneotrichosporon spelunceum]|uniref:Uncharacterized protein n=1 Tax=Cutaneotrichosporon spelunceum TaxID=1672016 RepID=A0AAD3TZF3_9TREE|nr:hypothetical protein CspeluHIS016_0801890 [Cutaneotrichosporon spelunceum]
MFTARALRPLSSAPRLVRARFNSTKAHSNEPSHGLDLLMAVAAGTAVVVGLKTAIDKRTSHVSPSPKVEEVEDDLQDKVAEAVSTAKETASEAVGHVRESASEAVDHAKENVSGALEAARVAASEASDKTKETVDDAVAAVKSKAASAAEAVKDAGHDAKDAVHESNEAALEKIRKIAEPLSSMPFADSVIADLMAEVEKALHGNSKK